jgi:hypothetical protein
MYPPFFKVVLSGIIIIIYRTVRVQNTFRASRVVPIIPFGNNPVRKTSAKKSILHKYHPKRAIKAMREGYALWF